MLPKALWESVRAQGSAQKNAQAGIQAGVGFQVSISEVPGGNLFFSPCLPLSLRLPGTSPPSTNSCFPPRQGSLSLIVNQTNSRSRPTVVYAGTCPSLNRYNSSNTWLDRWSIRSNRHREYRGDDAACIVGIVNSRPNASRACIPSLHPGRSIALSRVLYNNLCARRRHPAREKTRRGRTTMGAVVVLNA